MYNTYMIRESSFFPGDSRFSTIFCTVIILAIVTSAFLVATRILLFWIRGGRQNLFFSGAMAFVLGGLAAILDVSVLKHVLFASGCFESLNPSLVSAMVVMFWFMNTAIVLVMINPDRKEQPPCQTNC